MKLTLISAADIASALPMAECIEVMKGAFADFTAGRVQVPPRTVMDIDGEEGAGGTLLVKPAYIPQVGLGAKLVSVFPGNAETGRPVTPGIVVHMSPTTGEPLAILDGTFLTAWRTGAASGAATDLLSDTDAKTGALFGAGAQGRTQVLAIDAVREFETIRVFSRTPETVREFVQEMQPQVRAKLVAAESPSQALADADVICTATTSNRPVFDGLHLAEGAHVNAVGSFTPDMQEVDLETILRSRVFVDSIASVSTEPGDLLDAMKAGITGPSEWTEVGSIVEGESQGRQEGDDCTLFKSVGLAVQDIAAGAVVIERALEKGLGTEVDL